MVRFPGGTRGRSARLLLPVAERTGLGQPNLNASKRCRTAVTRVMMRQRAAVRGGSGYDWSRRSGLVYHRASAQASYLGYATEWRRNDRARAGLVQRNVEHGEKTARRKRPGARARRYELWRRSRKGTQGCLVVRRARRRVAQAMELQGINGLDPWGNRRKSRRPDRKARGKRRYRPPPWKAGTERKQVTEDRKSREKLQKEFQGKRNMKQAMEDP